MQTQILKCLQKIRKYGTITDYELVDLNHNQMILDRDSLKHAIKTKRVFVVNLKLTSDDKLIDCESNITNIIKYTKYYYKVSALFNMSTVECILDFDRDEVIISKINVKGDKVIIPDFVTGVDENIKFEVYDRSIRRLQVIHKNNQMKSMKKLFYNLSMDIIDLSEFDTRGVTNFSYMFYNCTRTTKIIFGKEFDTSSAVNMESMFTTMFMIKELDLRCFDVHNVKYMNSLFEACLNVQKINIDGWNTQNVITMASMFKTCKELTEIVGLNKLKANNLQDMSYMFCECDKLEFISLRGMYTPNLKSMEYTFCRCSSLQGVNLCNFSLFGKVSLYEVAHLCNIEQEIVRQLSEIASRK